jgi:hypothetical protein
VAAQTCRPAMSYAYLFKYIIIGDTGPRPRTQNGLENARPVWPPPCTKFAPPSNCNICGALSRVLPQAAGEGLHRAVGLGAPG